MQNPLDTPDRTENEQARSRIVYKDLRLILPEVAQKLGAMAEAPVFVSPVTIGVNICCDCGKEFTPLVYGYGRLVRAQHLCWNGGLWVYEKLVDRWFIGVCEAVGERLALRSSKYKGAGATITQYEGLRIVQLLVSCGHCWSKIDLGDEALLRHTSSGSLAPFHRQCAIHSSREDALLHYSPWRLTLTEQGEPLFSLED